MEDVEAVRRGQFGNPGAHKVLSVLLQPPFNIVALSVHELMFASARYRLGIGSVWLTYVYILQKPNSYPYLWGIAKPGGVTIHQWLPAALALLRNLVIKSATFPRCLFGTTFQTSIKIIYSQLISLSWEPVLIKHLIVRM